MERFNFREKGTRGCGARGVRTSNSHARYKSVKSRPPATPWTVCKPLRTFKRLLLLWIFVINIYVFINYTLNLISYNKFNTTTSFILESISDPRFCFLIQDIFMGSRRPTNSRATYWKLAIVVICWTLFVATLGILGLKSLVLCLQTGTRLEIGEKVMRTQANSPVHIICMQVSVCP